MKIVEQQQDNELFSVILFSSNINMTVVMLTRHIHIHLSHCVLWSRRHVVVPDWDSISLGLVLFGRGENCQNWIAVLIISEISKLYDVSPYHTGGHTHSIHRVCWSSGCQWWTFPVSVQFEHLSLELEWLSPFHSGLWKQFYRRRCGQWFVKVL